MLLREKQTVGASSVSQETQLGDLTGGEVRDGGSQLEDRTVSDLGCILQLEPIG